MIADLLFYKKLKEKYDSREYFGQYLFGGILGGVVIFILSIYNVYSYIKIANCKNFTFFFLTSIAPIPFFSSIMYKFVAKCD